MEPLNPAIAEMAAELEAGWPDPQADGTTILPPAALRITRALIAALIGYIEVQYTRCRVE